MTGIDFDREHGIAAVLWPESLDVPEYDPRPDPEPETMVCPVDWCAVLWPHPGLDHSAEGMRP